MLFGCHSMEKFAHTFVLSFAKHSACTTFFARCFEHGIKGLLRHVCVVGRMLQGFELLFCCAYGEVYSCVELMNITLQVGGEILCVDGEHRLVRRRDETLKAAESIVCHLAEKLGMR